MRLHFAHPLNSAAASACARAACSRLLATAKYMRQMNASSASAVVGVRGVSMNFLSAISCSRPPAKPVRAIPVAACAAKRNGRLQEAVGPNDFLTVMGITTMESSLDRLRTKPADNTGNHPGAGDGFNLELLAPSQLEAFSHSKAFNEAIRHDSRTDVKIARDAGISKGHLSKLRSGLWEEQAARLKSILFEVGHAGPVQKLVFDLGFELKRRKPRPKPKGNKS